MRPSATDSFLISFNNFHFLALLIPPSSPSLHTPRPSSLPVPPSSLSLLPRLSFLLVPASSSSLLPLRPSFFIVQHCLNLLESVKVHFSMTLTKALRTNGLMDQAKDKAYYRDAHPLFYSMIHLTCNRKKPLQLSPLKCYIML